MGLIYLIIHSSTCWQGHLPLCGMQTPCTFHVPSGLRETSLCWLVIAFPPESTHSFWKEQSRLPKHALTCCQITSSFSCGMPRHWDATHTRVQSTSALGSVLIFYSKKKVKMVITKITTHTHTRGNVNVCVYTLKRSLFPWLHIYITSLFFFYSSIMGPQLNLNWTQKPKILFLHN